MREEKQKGRVGRKRQRGQRREREGRKERGGRRIGHFQTAMEWPTYSTYWSALQRTVSLHDNATMM